jgi:hypothetical protein
MAGRALPVSESPHAGLFFVGQPAGKVLQLGVKGGGCTDRFAVGVLGRRHKAMKGLTQAGYLLLYFPKTGHLAGKVPGCLVLTGLSLNR